MMFEYLLFLSVLIALFGQSEGYKLQHHAKNYGHIMKHLMDSQYSRPNFGIEFQQFGSSSVLSPAPVFCSYISTSFLSQSSFFRLQMAKKPSGERKRGPRERKVKDDVIQVS